jgi:hypothetical protein
MITAAPAAVAGRDHPAIDAMNHSARAARPRTSKEMVEHPRFTDSSRGYVSVRSMTSALYL